MGIAIAVIATFFVVRAGEDTKWKVLNFLIIVGSTALGVTGALVIEQLIDLPQGFPGTMTLVVGILSAFIGCFIAGAWNYWRNGGKKGGGVKKDQSVV